MKRPLAIAAAGLAVGSAAATPSHWINTDTGAPLRPGFYGRIQVREGAPPPPVVHAQPVTVERSLGPTAGEPVYLYVPPGQLRRWAQHCGKWNACDRPVLFVRVDDSPSKLGEWKKTQRPQPQPSFILHALDRIRSQ